MLWLWGLAFICMFPGLVRVHEDEGRPVVISVSSGLRRAVNRRDDDKATEGLTLFQQLA